MSKHDLKAKILQVVQIVLSGVGNWIRVDTKFRYNQPNVFDDDRDIPDIGWVKDYAGSGGTATAYEFTGDNIENNSDNPYLDISSIPDTYRVVSKTTDISGEVEEMIGNAINYTNGRIYGVSEGTQNFVITVVNI